MHTDIIENKSDEAAVKEGCFFSEERAGKAIRFIEQYCIPSTVGKKIILLPWQRNYISKLYGWRTHCTVTGIEKSRWQRATLSTAKKKW